LGLLQIFPQPLPVAADPIIVHFQPEDLLNFRSEYLT
jgi:hypothetical protein